MYYDRMSATPRNTGNLEFEIFLEIVEISWNLIASL